MVIDASWSRDAVLPPERLHPGAPGVVQVGRDHSHRPVWRPGDSDVPESFRQVLNEIDRDAVVRSPRGNDRGPQIGWPRQTRLLTRSYSRRLLQATLGYIASSSWCTDVPIRAARRLPCPPKVSGRNCQEKQ